jgi:hypothetical protein
MFDVGQSAHKAFRNLLGERTSSVVAWIGSGFSQSAGLPSWRELRNRVVDAARDKCRSLPPADAAMVVEKLTVAGSEPNHWIAIDILKSAIGDVTYRETVRDALRPAVTVRVPEAYAALWKLRLGGVLNLNLDRLATRAHSEAFPGNALHEFSGIHAGRYLHLLKSPTPFIVNLHGIAEDESTWVLTNPELKRLTNTAGYREFVRSTIASRTILFIGVTADDLAVGGHLESLIRSKIDAGTHYWVTHRTDAATDRWAEHVGIRVIRYRSDGADHSELQGFFSDILGFVPKDDVAPPVRPSEPPPPPESLPNPREITYLDAEQIRRVLNGHASGLLASSSPESYDAYARFCRKYDQAIYRSWYVTLTPPDNILLDYTLHEEIASGAFGKVYRATTADGKDVAVKLLHEACRTNPEMLQSFRRGVRSMRILDNHHVAGMVPYRATEQRMGTY